MLPRRCLPSWLGWQLHVSGGGSLVDVGLAVALPASLARALPGCVVVPGKDLVGGLVAFLGKDLVENHHLLI